MSKLSWLIAVFFAGLVAFVLFVVGDAYLSEEKIKLPPPDDYGEESIPWEAAGIINPQIEPADTTKIQPNQKVIGITVGGTARAYLLAAMDRVDRTVVNDLIAGTPVSVTYYPMESLENEPQTRVRVFADENGSEPLVMGLAGVEKGKMMIYCQVKKFFQMGSKISVWHDTNQDGKRHADEVHYLTDVDFEVLPWGAWKKAHPESDVYLGKGTIGEPPAQL